MSDIDQLRSRIYAAAAQFIAAHPQTDEANGFYPCEENETILLNWIEANGYPFDKTYSFEEAFANCRGKLIVLPPVKAAAPKPPAPQKVCGVEISHKALSKLTAEQFERLAANKEFAAAVDALPRPNVRIDR